MTHPPNGPNLARVIFFTTARAGNADALMLAGGAGAVARSVN